jgi:hypothetical protein
MNKTWTTILSSTVVVAALGGLGKWSMTNYNNMHAVDQQRVTLEKEKAHFSADQLKAHDTDQAKIRQQTDALNAKELELAKKADDLASRENDLQAEAQALQKEETTLHAQESDLVEKGQAISYDTQRAVAETYIRQRMTEFDQLGVDTTTTPPCNGPQLAQYNHAKSIVSEVSATAKKWELYEYTNWAVDHGLNMRLLNVCN